jgi:hypothetical protein
MLSMSKNASYIIHALGSNHDNDVLKWRDRLKNRCEQVEQVQYVLMVILFPYYAIVTLSNYWRRFIHFSK